MRLLGDAGFCVCTFFGRSQTDEKYGANGLPLTPVSVRIIGKFQQLKSCYHPCLCRYLDISRGKYDQIFVVSEYHNKTLASALLSDLVGSTQTERFLTAAFQLFSALDYLNSNGLIHRCLSPENIFVTSKGLLRIAHYGLFSMTENGVDVPFAIGNPKFLAPEVLGAGPHGPLSQKCGPKSDIWSAGLVLLHLALASTPWPSKATLFEIVQQVLSCYSSGLELSALGYLFGASAEGSLRLLGPEAYDLVHKCLMVSSKNRPTAAALLRAPCFRSFSLPSETTLDSLDDIFRCTGGVHPSRAVDGAAYLNDVYNATLQDSGFYSRPICQRPIDEVFALWKIAGPSAETILEKKGLVKTRAPIRCLPNVVIDECEIFGREDMRLIKSDLTFIPLSTDNLQERLKAVDAKLFYPCLEVATEKQQSNGNAHGLVQNPVQNGSSNNNVDPSLINSSEDNMLETAQLPAVIKEKDIEYQLKRQVLIKRLLQGYPYKKSVLWNEARIDIPPLYRGYVWAALLDVKGDIDDVYDSVDKRTVTPTDRQIDVDVPRCHQYDELLSSPEGHRKFKRILKAWVASHPNHVYWQGLDSLCAPFLYLHFNNEALAYACLTSFIPKYLYNFFLKDNSAVIHEYLAIFAHLIAYHDPDLCIHLSDIGFFPELYAIPWFLTMFAHVFPLHKIFHLWDTLLLGNSSFPLFVGVAIMSQLRDQLMSSGFNECILLFSDLPEIDIERCVHDSIELFCHTPRSATFREHAPPVALTRERSKTTSFIAYSLESPSELSMSRVPLDTLRSEVSPRICAEELMQLCGLKGSGGGGQKGASAPRPRILPLDIRPKEEYLKSTLPDALNIPFHVAFNKETGKFNLPPNNLATELLHSRRGQQIVVVLGSKACSSAQFSAELVKLGYPRVCSLHNDIGVFRNNRTQDIFIVPSH